MIGIAFMLLGVASALLGGNIVGGLMMTFAGCIMVYSALDES